MPGPRTDVAAGVARGPRRRRTAGALACVLVLAGCTTAQASTHPTWVPQPSLSAIGLPTAAPPGTGTANPSDPAGPSGGGSAPGATPPVPSGTGAQIDPNVVATRLTAPTGLAVLPDGTALVGERTTGRILLVQPVAGKPVRLVKTLTGLDPSGGGGLLDLALSASFAEDGLVLALITTRRDNRVVEFTIGGAVTPVLTGIPRGASDNTGRLLVGLRGTILVGTGDAGKAARAADPASPAGKVLRIDELGRPAAGNPKAGSATFTSGHRTVDGLCADPATGITFEVETDAADELNILRPGASYGWPNGGGTAPIGLPAQVAGVGDCAVAGGNLYVTGLGGQGLFRAKLDDYGRPGAFSVLLHTKYGRLLTVVAAPDGSLWLTTSNRDGHGHPVAADERVLHIAAGGGGGGAPPV